MDLHLTREQINKIKEGAWIIDTNIYNEGDKIFVEGKIFGIIEKIIHTNSINKSMFDWVDFKMEIINLLSEDILDDEYLYLVKIEKYMVFQETLSIPTTLNSIVKRNKGR